MAIKEVANEDLSVEVTPNGAWTPGTPSLILLTSSKTKLNSKKAVINQISWTISGCLFDPNTFVSGAPAVPIIATALKGKCDSIPVLRKDDQGSCAGSFLSPVAVPIPCSCVYKIGNAGQTKVKCE